MNYKKRRRNERRARWRVLNRKRKRVGVLSYREQLRVDADARFAYHQLRLKNLKSGV